jgi:2-enoate reductase
MQSLFEPGNIGKLVIKNRIVMAPMGTTGMVEPDGRYSQRAIDYFVARAKGGVGLIITGLMAVDFEIEKRAPSPWSIYPRVDSPIFIARLNELTDAVHEYGAKISAQFTAGAGRNARKSIAQSGWAIAPSSQPCFWDPSINARELTVEEIETLVKAFGVGAVTVKAAGFDAIELHGHEGYLMDQFMTALWNKRTDKYGGELEGRLTFLLEIIAAIRQAVGEEFPLIYRMAGRHHIEGGRDIDESVLIAKRLEEAGVNCLHIDAGCYEAWDWAHPPIYQELTVEDASKIKSSVGIPVIAVGRLDNPKLAEKIVAEGKADFVALGRGLLADPEWPNKFREGRFEDIRPCIGDHDGCMGRIFDGKYLSCTVNPQAGMERELSIQPTPHKKSVLVIGGGPAGMEAARVGALRGHEVTLWEKNGQLGGNLIPASVPEFMSDMRDLISYMSCQIDKVGVRIELETEASPELVINSGADEVIVATGAVPLMPEISGHTDERVATACDLLLGKREASERIAVIGGGYIGCETGLWLAQNGKKVTIIEAVDELMRDEFLANKQFLLRLLADTGVKMMTRTQLLEITDKGVLVGNSGGKALIEAGTVALAIGLKPVNSLIDALKGAHVPVHAIGDCIAPRKLLIAMWEAFRLGLRI